MLLKKLVVLIVLAGLLCLMLPATSFAAEDRSADLFGSGTYGWIVAGIIIALAIWYWVMWEDFSPGPFFPSDAGEMFVDLPGLRTTLFTGGNLPLDDTLNYNIDWMLTDSREGRLWTAAGMTFRFPFASDGDFAEETDIGGNIRMGFRDGQWDYHLCVSAFAMDDSETMAWMTYRY